MRFLERLGALVPRPRVHLVTYHWVLAPASPDRALVEALIHALTRDQASDGSWSNPNRLVKEDDPLIATALALRALNNQRGK